MMIEGHSKGHKIVVQAVQFSALLIAGAIAFTWSWNTIVPDLSGLPRVQFAEGLSISTLTVCLGALFALGQKLVTKNLSDTRR